jgi:hypothetical protein
VQRSRQTARSGPATTLHPGRRLPLSPEAEVGRADLVVAVEVAAGGDEELAAVVAGVPRHVVGRRVVLAAGVRELDKEAGSVGHQITPSRDRGRIR